MFCPKCGNKLPDEAKFCAMCGRQVEGKNISAKQNLNNRKEEVKKSNKNNTRKNFEKPKHLKLYIGLAVAIVAMIIGIIIGVSIYQQPIKDYENSYKSLISAKELLNAEIKSANNKVSENSASTVKDTSKITDLENEIKSANSVYEKSIPEEHPSYSDLKSKKQEADTLKDEFLKARDNLKNKSNELEKSKSDKSNELVSLQDINSGTIKDNSGYEIGFNVKASNWFKASDTNNINNAWRSAGGRNSAPSISTFNSKYGNQYYSFSNEASIVLIGSVSFENKTNNFHISSTNKKNPSLCFNAGVLDEKYKSSSSNNKNSFNMQIAYAVNYTTDSNSDNTKYGSTHINSPSSGTSEYNFISAEMKDDKWGPVAFMLVVTQVFTPNYPNGDPAIDTLVIQISNVYYGNSLASCKDAFLPKKTW